MKKTLCFATAFCLLAITACKKDNKTVSANETPAPAVAETYASVTDFYVKNGVSLETFTFTAGNGGDFVSAKGSTIHVAANTFTPGSANIKLEFKDIYAKSDMLLSNMSTRLYGGAALVSAGEFFIRALNNNVAVDIAAGGKIDVLQPANLRVDKDMTPFIAGADSSGIVAAPQNSLAAWFPNPSFTLLTGAQNYVFSLFNFGWPVSGGTWCNSDNSKYFGNVPQTTLTLVPNNVSPSADVFLVFKVNSMVHVYKSTFSQFKYLYAPLGYECTVVALDVKDGKLYSAFTPIKISANQVVTFDLTETNTENFKATLKALD